MSVESRKTNNYVTLDSIVRNVINDLGDYDQSNWKRYKQWVIRGAKGLSLHILKPIEVGYFTVDANNCVQLPDDYLAYRRVGVVIDGRIWTLTQDDTIPITREESCGDVAQYADIMDEETIPETYTWFNAPPKVFNIAYHRYDEEYNRMIFSGNVAGQSVAIEYFSTGVSLNGETHFPVQAEEPLIAWTHWQRVLHDKNSNESERASRERIFNNATYDLLNYETMNFNFDDLVDVLNAGNSQLAKR